MMWLFGSLMSWGMFCTGVVLLILILLKRHLRYRSMLGKREASHPGKPADESAVVGTWPSRRPPPELNSWEVSMHETARVLKAELDSKMVALQHLVAMAQEETSRLDSMILRAQRLGIAADGELSEETDHIESSEAVHSGFPSQLMDSYPDREHQHQVFPVDEACRAKIYALADQGQTPERISRTVAATVGEVEMVLHLRKI